MKTITERLAEPRLILIDGGTGTEMEKRGARMEDEGWTASSTLTEPEMLRQIHKDYVDAGAEVIITNTFSCSKHIMKRCGLEDRFEEVNRLATQIACDVRDNHEADHQVWVAGSISPAVHFGTQPDEKTARDNFKEQAHILAESGVDFFMLEMLRDVEQTTYIMDAVNETGLPVIMGFTTLRDEEGQVQLGVSSVGGTFEEVFTAVDTRNVPLVTIMHTLIENIDPSLELIKQHWSGPLGVYAHYGHFVMPNWIFTDTITPEAYADAVQGWVNQGVRLIGGCCGIGPAHIKELSRWFG